MMRSIKDNRIERNGMYEVMLQMSEDEYFNVYDDITSQAASEIMDNYLHYHGDDARPSNIHIDHNKNGHVVNITANLNYLGNDHTEGTTQTPDILNITRDNIKRP